MRLTSSLSFPHLTFRHWTLEDCEAAVLIVKGTFGINPDGGLGVVADQAAIAEVDSFWGDENASSLKQEQDIAPSKTCTDVTVDAIARSPDGKATPEWPVSIEVKGRAFYGFHVRGPSEWRKERGRWRLSAPEPVTEVPIRYELAYGGSAPAKEGPEFHDFNPVGRGFVNDRLLARDEPIPAPQIGDIAAFMAGNIEAGMTVHGLGPIAKAWLPRRSEAGTFDEAWKNTRHPRMPKDYSFAFWNAAPRRLQLSPWLTGGERFILRGFRHDPAPCEFTLPMVGVVAHKDSPDGPMGRLHLTDVQIDIADPDPGRHRITLIWRGLFADPDEIEALHIAAAPVEEPEP
ncbi:DUF2169 family type VI secretion system accessory protein [Paracoccus pantotrophus]|uniref:DUF2169 family type VI secretion system accessory protein n=1 Tax=Paracoccus pantotrophus TaxID=82367 RepID=UPI0008E636A3|nr:DUF2169 domain-containing protein [Paracoccus pantotrophus]MDF3855836.1 DUF2169 domain-containing protein [Paracoccus pantotrophus]SFO82827.1 hypothetical protein SAMN04244567_03197 [Paracoccus pantotrophus]